MNPSNFQRESGKILMLGTAAVPEFDNLENHRQSIRRA